MQRVRYVIPGSDILRVAVLGRGDALAFEFFQRVDAGILARDDQHAIGRRSGKHANTLAAALHVPIKRRAGTDISDVDGAGE